MQDTTLIIIPTYNEAENVPGLVARLLEVAPNAHVLLVDDGSPDGTADIAEARFGGEPRVGVMRRTGRRGLGRSYVDGYNRALADGYARVVQMDADFSHDPDSVPALVAASLAADVVVGSRYCPGGGVRNWPLRREALSRFANRYVAAITGLTVADATAGFRCYTRRAIERMHVDTIESNGYAFQVEMTHRAMQAGLPIVEVPIIFTDRQAGRSKISRAVLLESMLMPWRLRLRLGSARRLRPAPAPPGK